MTNHIYARYALKTDGSIQQQVDTCLAYLETNDAASARTITTDVRSGNGIAPSLGVLIAQMKPGDKLVVTKTDRLTRNYESFKAIAETLKSKGCELVITNV